jgi:hypothetical protein
MLSHLHTSWHWAFSTRQLGIIIIIITTIFVGLEWRRKYQRQHTVIWWDSFSAGTLLSWHNRNFGRGNWELEKLFYVTISKYWCQVTCKVYTVFSDKKHTAVHIISPHRILSDTKNNKQQKDTSVNMFYGFSREPY